MRSCLELIMCERHKSQMICLVKDTFLSGMWWILLHPISNLFRIFVFWFVLLFQNLHVSGFGNVDIYKASFVSSTAHSRSDKITPKISLPWTTTNLVPKAIRVNLHVLEDDRIISWLGRQKFVELCIHVTSG